MGSIYTRVFRRPGRQLAAPVQSKPAAPVSTSEPVAATSATASSYRELQARAKTLGVTSFGLNRDALAAAVADAERG